MRDYVSDGRLFVHPQGNDENGGLRDDQPLRTIVRATEIAWQKIDFVGKQAKIMLAAGGDFACSVGTFGQPTGTNLITFEGAGPGVIWRPGDQPWCSHLGNNAQIGIRNLTADSSLTPGKVNLFEGHQQGVLDAFENVRFRTKASDGDIVWDRHGQININAGLTLAGERCRLFDLGPFCMLDQNGPLVSEGAAAAQLYTLWPHAHVLINGNVEFVGNWGGLSRQWCISECASLRNLSGRVIPGSAG